MLSFSRMIAGGFLLAASVGLAADRPRPTETAGREPASVGPIVPRIEPRFGRMPLSFIPNEGQLDPNVVYYVAGRDTHVYFEASGLTISLASPVSPAAATAESSAPPRPAVRAPGPAHSVRPKRWAVKLDFVGATPDIRPRGEEETGTVVSYFKGRRDEWKPGLHAYSRIVYKDLWPGIDLAYSGSADLLKYEFVVRPGADPSAIRLAYRGASRIALDSRGRLVVDTPLGGFQDQAPVAYQDRSGKRVPVSARFLLQEHGNASAGVGFVVGSYDPTLPLVIDPATVIYCGFLGGAADDQAMAVAIDGAGNAYLAGRTISPGFPVAVGPDLSFNDLTAESDAFVAKVSSDGSSLVYCGFIGGQTEDVASGIAVDADGNAYLSGWTFSLDFPVAVGPRLSPGAEIWQRSDAFVTKVSADGTALVYSGYVGGSWSDQAHGIAVDSSGRAHVTGWTDSAGDFPIVGGIETAPQGGRDAFVTRVRAAGTGFEYSIFVGGAQNDTGAAIALDPSGFAYIAGSTTSPPKWDSRVWVDGDQVYNGNQDAFAARISPWAVVEYCGYIGGAGVDAGTAIAVDFLGSAYVTGTTDSGSLFPVTGGPGLVHHGGTDAFVAKLRELSVHFLYCGFIGGPGDDRGQAIAVDRSGRAYVAGSTASAAEFPVKDGPFLTHAGGTDAFVVTLGPTGENLLYGSYLGGSGDDAAAAIATDGSGNVFLAGGTKSADFPVTPAAIPGTGHGPAGLSDDVFVARISEDLPPCGPFLIRKGNVTESEIEISWPDESTNESGFRIERQDNPPPEWAEIATVGADVTSFTDTGRSEGYPYIYRVRAFNDFGDSDYSIPLLIFTRPLAPSDLAATAINERRIELSWVNHSARAEEYLVERRVHDYDNWTLLSRTYYGATSYIDTNYVREDTTYTYRVLAAVHDGTESLPSNEALVTTPPLSLPLAPSNLEASAPLATQVTLTWVNNAFNAAGFKVERRTGPAGAWGPIAAVDLTNNFYVDGTAGENTAYSYRVCAYNNAGNSGYSNEASLTTPAFRPILRLPLWDVSFGYADVCTAVYQISSLFNDGDAPLVVSGITRNSGSLDFVYLGPEAPFTIAPGGSAEIALGFRPSQPGSLSAVFSVLSNDPVNGSSPLAVTGLGMGLSVNMDLEVQRGVVRAWIAQMHYARINAQIVLSAQDSDVTFRLMRKSGSASYQPVKVFTWADTRGGTWSYTDMYLAGGTSYSYKVEALDCRSQVIAQTPEVGTGVPSRQVPSKAPVRTMVKR